MTVDVEKRLKEIAAELKRTGNYAKYEKEMDRLLGTEMEERDEEAEKRWEGSYRENRETD